MLLRFPIILAALTLALLSMSCSGSSPTACTLELIVGISPRDTTLSVGESFIPKVETGGGCTKVAPTPFSLSTPDPNTAQVDNFLHTVKAVRSGIAVVAVSDATGRYGSLGQITVHVR
ncbi:MAG: hypothetical protein JWO05_997 [Gemmatimonadetes bacterium]|nr:hypothetical protein [Gemmatimonadota bacterium]